jgi:hypothetical protein
MSTISKVYTPRSANNNTITIAPEFADIDIADTYNQLVDRQNTTIGELLTPDIMPASELQANMDYRNAFKQGDTITAVNNYFSTLNNYVNQPDFSLDAVLYWYQKATYSNKEITAYKSAKNHYNTFLLPNYIPGASLFGQNIASFTNHDFSYFNVVSDSIGIITNSKFIQLDNTLPLFDITQGYYGVPIPIAASTDNKISSITRNVMYNLSQKNTTIMRRNLMNIGYSNTALQQNIAADATTSHGCNLINDLPTFVRINKILDQLKNKLATVFTQAKTFSFVQYLNNIGNTTALNLRDIFPLASSDMDFTVITSDANAAAAAAIAQQQANDAAAAQQIADQQYRIDVGNIGTGGSLQGSGFTGTALQPIQVTSTTGTTSQDGQTRTENNISVDTDGPTNPNKGKAGEGTQTRSNLDSNIVAGVIGTEAAYKSGQKYDVIINAPGQNSVVVSGLPVTDTNKYHGIGNPSPVLNPNYPNAGIPIELTAAALKKPEFQAAGITVQGNSVNVPRGVTITVRPAGSSITTVASRVPIPSPTTGG